MTLCTSKRLIGQLAIASLSILTAGCSADVARFDSPSFSLNGSSSTASLPKPVESVRPSSGKSALGGDRNDSGTMDSGAYIPPPRRDARDSGIQVANLPEAKSSPTPPPAAAAPVGEPPRRPGQSAQPAPAYAAPPAPQASAAASGARGEQIEVQHGDTLYGISKKYKVSLNELLQVNGLTNPNLKPGQKLYLPAGKGARKPLTKGETAALSPVGGPAPSAASAGAVPAAPADIASWNGTYTVKAGDSLYAVSRQYKVRLADLQGANGIADVRKVKPGAVLKVPGSGGGATASLPPATGAAAAATAAEPVAAAPVQPATSTRPTIINGDKTAAVAPKTDTPPLAAAEPAQSVASSGKLRWPVKGKVIATFGARPDGTSNDGVNLAVPMGTEVHAAEAGVVAYAGNELKGYGNLVLIRHDNGWVTAYAHNDEIGVKRGDKVKRGQAIAKAGKSGQVDQPQVHFELRQGAKPVDPTPFMERL